MSAPTVLVLGQRRTDNMPSLTRMLEILKPREGETPGMDATMPTSSVRITAQAPVVMGGPHDDCCDCGCEGCGNGDLGDD